MDVGFGNTLNRDRSVRMEATAITARNRKPLAKQEVTLTPWGSHYVRIPNNSYSVLMVYWSDRCVKGKILFAQNRSRKNSAS